MVANPLESTEYQYGFHDENVPVFKSKRGLDREVVENISYMKNEPDWMRKFRLRSLDAYERRPMPNWGGAALHDIDFDNIFYYLKPSEGQSKSWADVPSEIKNTFDRLGIPEAEKKILAGVGAQYESEVIYHNIREDLEKQGVIFCDTDSAVNKYPELMKKYFGKTIPFNDNKFASLNSAVWSGGSFI
ncbi:MAG: Fe-S cluster assembly protein SufB, partial [Chloroflexi bacterium]|nr:Fe-S cluster assembly protein SufB [Chloroflexota bacterium]